MQPTRQQVLDAIKRGRAEKLREDLEYVRFRDSDGKIMRGTVVTKSRVIPGYGHIPRVFTLGKGITRNIKSDEVCIEEKIDGFNLRVAKVEGRIFAFSRGGYIDAFSTEKARDLGLGRFFKDYPEGVLCGEMIGNTPYTEPTERFDVKLFVFDIDDGSGIYMPCEERYAVLKRYGIESVPALGRYKVADIGKIRNLALSLNKAKKEGMVIKTPDRKAAVKFVTPNADIEDIEKGSPLLFDMPLGFYLQRVFRSGMSIREFGLDRGEYAKRLGEAFYSGLTGALEKVENGRESEAEFEIFVRDPGTWETIHRHMSKEVKLDIISNRDERGGKRIRFRKIYKKTTKTLHDALSGKSVTD
jgi:putative ATP-dependent DNA ligase